MKDYKKKYEEALDKARKLDEDGCHVLRDVFPELQESEDERIRKWLIRTLKSLNNSPVQIDGAYEMMLPAIDWLEKQGGHAKFINGIQVGDKVTRNEDGVLVNLSQLKRVTKKDEKQGKQKPADKVEPKFEIEEGKWYVCIRDLLDNYANKAFCKGDIYLSTQNGSLIPSNSNVPFEVVCPDTYFKDWTIQDAKDGDVLAIEPIEEDYQYPFVAIYKERGLDFFNSYCFIGFDGKFWEAEAGHSTKKNSSSNQRTA